MKKFDEQQIAEMVYGRNANWEIVPSESPDFVCKRNGVIIHGIEVTEYFDNQSEARLQKILDYPTQLLKSASYRHKDDKECLEVKRITYHPKGDPSKGIELNAICINPLPLERRLHRLAETIGEKSAKCATYLAQSPYVDLLVFDRQRGFNFVDFTKLYRPLSASPVRQTVVSSQFREVFLITYGKDEQLVCVPLKANAFVEEIILAKHILMDGTAGFVPKNAADLIMIMVLMLIQKGFGSARLSIKDSDIQFLYSSIDILANKDGLAIHDYTQNPGENMNGQQLMNWNQKYR